MHLLNETVEIADETVDMDGKNKFDKYTINGKRIVTKMSLSLFQQFLVNRFDIKSKQSDVAWPRHIKKTMIF